MKLKNLTQIYILRPVKTKVDGEYTTTWEKAGTEYINIQQDYDELDKQSSGNIDYSSYNARIDKDIGLQKGYGIALTDKEEPEYIVNSLIQIGKSRLYKINKIVK